MPKKHDPKKRERKKRGNHVSKKKREKDRDDPREKTIASRSKLHPSIHSLMLLHLLIDIA